MPNPLRATANAGLLSVLAGLVTVSVAVTGNGHADGEAPESEAGLPYGSHGQLCCGLKEMVMEQDCPRARENDDPGEVEQLSCSAKLGSPLKSLEPGNWLSVSSCRFNCNPFNVEVSVLTSVTVCVVEGEPSSCSGKVKLPGVSVTGCWHAFDVPMAMQMVPESPGLLRLLPRWDLG